MERVARGIEPIDRFVDPARGLGWYADFSSHGDPRSSRESQLKTHACGRALKWRLASLRRELAEGIEDAHLACTTPLECFLEYGHDDPIYTLLFVDDPERGLTLVSVIAIDESRAWEERPAAESFFRLAAVSCPPGAA